MRWAVLIILLLAAVAGLVFWLQGSEARLRTAEVETATPMQMQPTESRQAHPSPIVNRPYAESAPVEVATTAATTRESRPTNPGMARLTIPILEADGQPAHSRIFDLVFTTGVKTGKELEEEDGWIAMTLGASLRAGQDRFKYTAVESGVNEEGLAVCEVPADVPGHLRIRESPAGSQRSGFPGQSIKWIVMVAFPATPAGEISRLEPVRLPRVPLLVAGRVEADDGSPVKGATIQVAPAIMAPEDPALRRAVAGLGARSDAQGRYRVETDATSEGWLAWANVDGAFASEVTPFKQGQTDLVLRVRATGAIKGRVRTAPALGEREPAITLEPEGTDLPYGAFGGRWSPRTYPQVNKKTGEFSRDGIPAGVYRLFVSVSITRVLTIEHVVIEPGKTNEDPRFADLVVGEQLRLAVVRVVDENDRPVVRATVYWAPSDQGGAIRGGATYQTDTAGECALPLPEDAIMNIKVEAPGARPWQRDRVTLPLLVKLDSGARIAVELPGSSDWAHHESVADYLLCLVPEDEVESAVREKRNPIPARLHRSHVQTVRPRKERYSFEGAEAGRKVVFIVPRKRQVGKTIGAGEWSLLHDDQGLEIGRLDLKPGSNPDVTFQVNTDKLMALVLR